MSIEKVTYSCGHQLWIDIEGSFTITPLTKFTKCPSCRLGRKSNITAIGRERNTKYLETKIQNYVKVAHGRIVGAKDKNSYILLDFSLCDECPLDIDTAFEDEEYIYAKCISYEKCEARRIIKAENTAPTISELFTTVLGLKAPRYPRRRRVQPTPAQQGQRRVGVGISEY